MVLSYPGLYTHVWECSFHLYCIGEPGAKTVKKNTNSTQNKSQTDRAKQYEVTSFLSTDCELSTETCSKNVYSLGPWLPYSVWDMTPAKGHCRSAVVYQELLYSQSTAGLQTADMALDCYLGLTGGVAAYPALTNYLSVMVHFMWS